MFEQRRTDLPGDARQRQRERRNFELERVASIKQQHLRHVSWERESRCHAPLPP